MAQAVMDVGVRLQVLQSSLKDLENLLKNLKPDTSAFKGYQKIIADVKKEIEGLQVQTSKPFISERQFTQTARSLDKIENSLIKANLMAKNLKFNDIKITPDQQKSFDAIEQEIAEIEKKYNLVQEKIKSQIFSGNNFSQTLKLIDPKLISKDFETIEKTVNQEVDILESKLSGVQERLKIFNNSDAGRSLEKDGSFLSQGMTLENSNKYIYQNKNGILGFKPGTAKAEFLKQLQEEYSLSPSDVANLRKMTFTQINDAFKSMGRGETPNIFSSAISGLQEQKNELLQKVNEYQESFNRVKELQNALNQASGEGTELSTASLARNAALDEVAQKLEVLKASILETTTASGAFNNANEQMQGVLGGLRGSLDETSAAFLRMQQRERDLNSIKMAVMNFLGFHQVLNLVRTGVRNAINHIKELDTVMNGISIVTDMTTADLWKQVDVYSQMAQNYGVSIKGAYEVSRIYYQQGGLNI